MAFGRKDQKSGNGVLNVFGKQNKSRHPAQPIAKLNVPDARRVLPKDFLPLFYHKGQGSYISKLFLYQKIKFKERKR